MLATRLPPQDGTFATSTFTSPSARVSVRIARFTRICWIARRPRDFVRRSCANSHWTNRIGGLETAASCFVHQRFTSVAARLRRFILRNWDYCCAAFTTDSNYRNWLNGQLKQIREASPRERRPSWKNSESTGSASACSRGTRNY